MPTYVYACPNKHHQEHRSSISAKPETLPCPECGEPALPAINYMPAVPTTIVVDYPGSKRFKAGYMHTHADRKGDKIQVGYGGKVTPRDPNLKRDENGNVWTGLD